MTARRTVPAAGAAVLTAGCGSRRPEAERDAAPEGPVRTDTTPLPVRLHGAHRPVRFDRVNPVAAAPSP